MDLLDPDRRTADLLVQAHVRGEPATILIHLEHQAQKGRTEGRAEGLLEVVVRQLVRRCGPLAVEVQRRIAELSPNQLLALSEALLDFTTIEELIAWLAQAPVDASAPHP